MISKRSRAVTLGLLTATYFSSFVDRQILAILQEEIKIDLNLTDTQLGLLSGLMFGLFYSTLAVPIARVADRANRRNIIAASVAVWSLMTVAGGFAQNFVQLALARMGVGIGEAGSVPASNSIIAALYPPERRAGAMAVFSIGAILGAGFGTMLGGLLAHHYGWRVAMFSLGLPGLLLALLVRLYVVEPPRLAPASTAAAGGEGAATIGEAARALFACAPVMHLITALALVSTITYAVIGWGPSYMQRSMGFAMLDIARYIALPGALFGVASALIGGRLADYMARTHGIHAQIYVVAVAKFLAFPFSLAFFLFPQYPAAALVGYFGSMLFASAHLGPTMAMIQHLAPPHMRAMWAAMALLAVNLIGLGVGPLLVGQISDLLRPTYGEESLRYAMLALVLISPWPVYHYWRTGVLIRRLEGSEAAAEQDRFGQAPGV